MTWRTLLDYLRRREPGLVHQVEGMGRRAFLQALTAGAIATTATALVGGDLEQLVWLPGERTMLLPDVVPITLVEQHGVDLEFTGGRRGGNTLLTIDMITQEALRVLENQLVFSKHINREYAAVFTVPLLGDEIRVLEPKRFGVITNVR